MLRFFTCFSCQQKSPVSISPIQISQPANQHQEQQNPEVSRKLSHQSFMEKETNNTSIYNSCQKNQSQSQSQVLQFIEKIQWLKLQQRKRLQSEFVKAHCFVKGPKFIIQNLWSKQYTEFLTKNNNKSTLREVDNSNIVSNGRIKSGLRKGKDYFIVSKKVWVLIQRLYGGGPEIQKLKMMPVKSIQAFGLENNRYSCYFNSGIQAIFSIPQFVDYFQNGCFKTDKRKTKFQQKQLSILTHQAIELLVESQKSKTFSLQNLRSFIQSRFSSVYQHDCQQFIRYYISRLQDQLNPIIRTSQGKLSPRQTIQIHEQSHISIVDNLFHGQLNSYTKCSQCNNVSIALDPIMELTIEMSCDSLKQCIDHYFNTEKLLDQYHCEKCPKKVKATKQFVLAKTPPYMMITVKRFFENQMKNSSDLEYPIQLDMGSYILDPEVPHKYMLQSAIIHEGDTEKGHYYTHTQRLDKWYQLNDGTIKTIQIQNYLKTEAYILIYRQV